ncbi:diguanylate cyclase [Desulfofundulus thermobenzoicus]|uniref:Diguanylate cyclase n=1 Tax=Desulfofundulus thermobenzoicus TaxID=29376 RepID=A0A6N7ITZ5_9FIRM|nr:GGDEF domain-containing protein [Desulfofundulus thermobenzoicus]MQL53605.1 diguanylate cyclase [Desulfofundulus thermobenzoicus]
MRVLVATGIEELDRDISAELSGQEIDIAGECYYRKGLLSLAKDRKADSVVLSPHLPGQTDTVDLVREIRMAGLRVVLLPGRRDDPKAVALARKAVALGVYDIVWDPVSPAAVTYRVSNPATLAEAGVEPDENAAGMPESPAVKKQASGKLLGKLAGKFKRGQDRRAERFRKILGACDTACCYAAGADECVAELDAQTVERIRARTMKMREMWDQAEKDPLTGLFNRRFLGKYLAEQERRYRETGVPFSLLMCDLDHFKAVNDTYGHDAGDAVLKEFAAFLAGGVRQVDLVARYGGEEFIIIFTGLDDARGIAERLCRGWAGQRIKLPDGQVISSTFSGGLAVMGRDARDVGGLIRAADGALYRAKGAGRNRVSAACSGTAPQKTKITRVPKIITVWSPLSIPIGKTFIAANLAAVLTWKGYSVLLIVPGPEIKWFNMQPDSLEKLLADPHRAWKMSGRCEEVPGVTLVAGIPKSAKSLKRLPVDIIVIDGVSAISSDLLLAVTIPGGTLNGGVPPDAQKIITVVNRAAQCYQSTDNHIVIPERADDAARGMKRGIPPVIYSKELAEAFIKLETAAGL